MRDAAERFGALAVRQQAVEDHQRAGLDRRARAWPRRSARACRRAARSSKPSPRRTKRSRNGPRCPPGATQRQPLSSVASSSAHHSPMTLVGSVIRKLASWCQTTSPPMRGCLKINIDCTSSGSATPRSSASAARRGSREKRLKSVVTVVQRVADLVDGARLVDDEAALGVEGLLLEEAAHLASGFDQRTLARARAVARRENGYIGRARLEGRDDFVGALFERVEGVRRGKAGPDQHAVAAPGVELIAGQYGWHKRCKTTMLQRAGSSRRSARWCAVLFVTHPLEESCTVRSPVICPRTIL